MGDWSGTNAYSSISGRGAQDCPRGSDCASLTRPGYDARRPTRPPPAMGWLRPLHPARTQQRGWTKWQIAGHCCRLRFRRHPPWRPGSPRPDPAWQRTCSRFFCRRNVPTPNIGPVWASSFSCVRAFRNPDEVEGAPLHKSSWRSLDDDQAVERYRFPLAGRQEPASPITW